MPTYQFEAMDATGPEIKDVIDAPTEEEAQATIRQMGYFVTKISVKKAAAGKSRHRRQKETRLRHRRRQDQAHLALHQAAFDSAGRRPADSPQPPHSRRPAKARPVEKRPGRRGRRDRRRRHAQRSDGQKPQGLQPAVCQHDQGRRGRRCAGSHSPPPQPSSWNAANRSRRRSKAR